MYIHKVQIMKLKELFGVFFTRRLRKKINIGDFEESDPKKKKKKM